MPTFKTKIDLSDELEIRTFLDVSNKKITVNIYDDSGYIADSEIYLSELFDWFIETNTDEGDRTEEEKNQLLLMAEFLKKYSTKIRKAA